ncbi:hypothetical protein KKG05_11750 [bacterium]|nr:hypothetical protein [bacterium]
MHGFTSKRRRFIRYEFLISITVILILQILTVHPASGFVPEKAGFSIRFKDEISPYRIIGVFVLPEEKLPLEALDKNVNNRYILNASMGKTESVSHHKWVWQAPKEIGLYPITIANEQQTDSIVLNIFVMIPYNELKGEYLNGYRIGKYPTIPLKQLPIYKPPRGFIELTPENAETLISPHFKLNQFLCKQESGYPKYLVLRERLLFKLELILEKLNEKGYHCATLTVMSGYRTPFYNHAIGNVKYSRHLWGGAADVFIDENPKDDMMDDLNGDHKINYRDAAVIYEIIDDMYGKSFYERFTGGLGWYKKTPSHGPFVHVDVRGFRARWGD